MDLPLHPPDTLYTLEDAALDLESLRADMGTDADLDLDAVTPEEYKEAMNHNIIHVWQSLPEEAEKDPLDDPEFYANWIESVQAAYIKSYGERKWLGLTDQQRHDVVMFITQDILKALETVEDMPGAKGA